MDKTTVVKGLVDIYPYFNAGDIVGLNKQQLKEVDAIAERRHIDKPYSKDLEEPVNEPKAVVTDHNGVEVDKEDEPPFNDTVEAQEVRSELAGDDQNMTTKTLGLGDTLNETKDEKVDAAASSQEAKAEPVKRRRRRRTSK